MVKYIWYTEHLEVLKQINESINHKIFILFNRILGWQWQSENKMADGFS